MAGFGKFTTTNRGLILLGKAQTGTELHFTKMKVGDGTLTGQSVATMTDLISTKMEIELNKLRFLGEGRAVVGGALSNAEITSGFFFREWGIFAEDPDEGEIMFCYVNAGSAADYIPPAASSVYEQQLNGVTVIGAAPNVTTEITSGVYASAEELQDHINNKDNPHEVTPAQIGAETPTGAQEKADAAESAAKSYADSVGSAAVTAANGYTDSAAGAVASSLAVHLAETTTQAHLAKNIGIEDTSALFTATDVEGALSELFTNVSNGKTEIATAITDVDNTLSPSGSDTFLQLANTVRSISTGKKWASGSQIPFVYGNGACYLNVTGLDFTPNVVIVSGVKPNSTSTPGYDFNDSWNAMTRNTDLDYEINAGQNGYTSSFYSNGFTIQVGSSYPTYTYKWIAYE
ncbi:Hypothetical protein DPCES_1423 [Desulfitobacterium hafniense]|uniref:Tail fiber protein n=1 Tax=Desulfitobacterium hafniense TaxID=49338 RepID=A0A098AYW2_DESHA|nr:hypothetical protein [Desulfitobacterium hafniense]CDX01310.1 Hypothetical protein DPCES_1423 [Desulfitobacterium hafniense]